jgi:hypothetical protein
MFVSSEVKVLRPAALIGVLAMLGSITFGVITIVCKLVFPELVQVQGWTSLALLVTFFGGLCSFLLGISLEYILIILLKTQGRPTYLVIDRSQDRLLQDWIEQRSAL